MIDFNMKRVGLRIKELRQESGMLQFQLAEKIGAAQNTIVQYEKGISRMSVEILFKLAIALKTTSDYLLGLTDIPN